MRKTLESLLVLACFCVSVSAQTPQTSDACRAELWHMTVPAYAQITGYDLTPLEFVFSQDGVDVYVAMPSSRSHYVNWIGQHGIRVIVVYQDELLRQEVIKWLLDPPNIQVVSLPHPIPIDNLKFAVAHYTPVGIRDGQEHTEKDELLAGDWAVEDVHYYAPQACVDFPQLDFCNEDNGSVVRCVLPGLHASLWSDNWVMDFTVSPLQGNITEALRDMKRKEYAARMYIALDLPNPRIIQAMRIKLKEFIVKNQNH